jgi:hypothetical protein
MSLFSLDVSDTLVSASVYIVVGIGVITAIAYAYIYAHTEENALRIVESFLHSAKIQTQLVIAASTFVLNSVITGVVLASGSGVGTGPDFHRSIVPYSVTYFIYLAIFFSFDLVALIVAIPAIVRAYRVMRREEESDSAYSKAQVLLRNKEA